MELSQALERQNSDLKIAQYYSIGCHRDNYAKEIFLNEPDINYKLSDTIYLKSNVGDLVGCTALHLAVKWSKSCDIEYLLSRGADPTIQNQDDLTPLHFAVENNCSVKNLYAINSSCSSLLSAQMKSGNLTNPSNKHGLSHFLIACMADHKEAIELFLKNGTSVDETVNIDSPYFPGYSPLHFAARFSALQAMKVLLKYGANTQLKDAKQMTFLYEFLDVITKMYPHYRGICSNLVKDNNLKMMDFLLQIDNDVFNYKGLTQFHLACCASKVPVAQSLLQTITDINHALDMDAPLWPGYTALHFAAHSSIEMVKMLVTNGANIQAEDAKGVIPLDICIEMYGVEDIHATLSLNATWSSILMSDRKTRLLRLIWAMRDINQFDHFFEPRMHVAKTFVPIDSPAWQKFTLLHIAVMFFFNHNSRNPKYEENKKRSKHIFKVLMANGANINAQDIRGWSPIHLAFRKPNGNRYDGVTDMLLGFTNKIRNVVDKDNLSHLHIACQMSEENLVNQILQTIVNVNLAFQGKSSLHDRNIYFGSTPLHCASTTEIVKLLLQYGANPLLKDVKGKTVIHRLNEHYEDLACLLTWPNLKDSIVSDSGLSHLHVACYNGSLRGIKTLLDTGADVNQAIFRIDAESEYHLVEKVGDTPLDYAVLGYQIYGSEDTYVRIVNLLIQRGAEILVKEPFIINELATYLLKSFVDTLNFDDNLFKHLEKEIGLTILHVACSTCDIDLIKELLRSGADVNAQINARSRLWPGYTPLHIVLKFVDKQDGFEEILSLLLGKGADVTIPASVGQETAVHLAYARLSGERTSTGSYIRKMLRAHKYFSVNPTRADGLSHFHVTCSVGDVICAESFLNCGADVNQPLHCFGARGINCDVTGYTPFHLTVRSFCFIRNRAMQMKLLNLLLQRGANVNAEDIHADTPLHFMAELGDYYDKEFLELVRFKADVNHTNVKNQTPLEVWLSKSKLVTITVINCFLKYGSIFNVFNSMTEKGLIAIALRLLPSTDQKHLIQESMSDFPQLMQTDEMGRTVIHNIVSNINGSITSDQYIRLIRKIEKFNLSVNDQDKLGRTALHLAVLFRNTKAISALLLVGVDVNVTDVNGKTALSYMFESCIRCTEKENYKLHDHNQYKHVPIFLLLVIHMKKLLFCGLDVHQTNKTLMCEVFDQFKTYDTQVPEPFKNQIKKLRNRKIDRSTLTLGNFLSETDAVVAYSVIRANRDSVDRFFKHEIWNLYAKYSEVTSILMMQYRKAVKRRCLIEPATFALDILLKRSVPFVCSTEILKFLSNSELSSMIEATLQFV